MFTKKTVAKALLRELETEHSENSAILDTNTTELNTFLHENGFELSLVALRVQIAMVLNDEPYPYHDIENADDCNEIVEDVAIALSIEFVLMNETKDDDDERVVKEFAVRSMVDRPKSIGSFLKRENILLKAFILSLSEDNIVQ